MKRFMIGAAIVGAAYLFSVLVDMGIKKRERDARQWCREMGEITELETRHIDRHGCFVRVNGRFVPWRKYVVNLEAK